MSLPNPDSLAVERLTKALLTARCLHSCLTCDHFQEHALPETERAPGVAAETCLLYKQRPPARVIALGCPSWTDGLPF